MKPKKIKASTEDLLVKLLRTVRSVATSAVSRSCTTSYGKTLKDVLVGAVAEARGAVGRARRAREVGQVSECQCQLLKHTADVCPKCFPSARVLTPLEDLLVDIETRWLSDRVAPSVRLSWEKGVGFHASVWRGDLPTAQAMAHPSLPIAIDELKKKVSP